MLVRNSLVRAGVSNTLTVASQMRKAGLCAAESGQIESDECDVCRETNPGNWDCDPPYDWGDQERGVIKGGTVVPADVAEQPPLPTSPPTGPFVPPNSVGVLGQLPTTPTTTPTPPPQNRRRFRYLNLPL